MNDILNYRLPIVPALPVYVLSASSVVGHEEYSGPLGEYFENHTDSNDTLKMNSWENAEAEMQKIAFEDALKNGNLSENDISIILAGDLLNQCSASNYGLINFNIPHLGIYGACSTVAEGLLIGSIISGTTNKPIGIVSSSHYCSAERQFRFPLEYGAQRTPTAQWTVTGAGAYVIGPENQELKHTKIKIVDVYPGISIDKGIKDANNMGAAMAPVSVKLRLQARGAEARPGLARRLFPLFSCLLLTGDSLPASSHFALRKNSAAQT